MPAAWREHFDNIFVLVIKLRSNRPTNRKSLFKKGYKVHFDLMIENNFFLIRPLFRTLFDNRTQDIKNPRINRDRLLSSDKSKTL